MSNLPLTILRSGAMERRYSYVGLSVRFPRQRVWPILPGVRSFLNCGRTLEGSILLNGERLPLLVCRARGLGCGDLR